jgi:hypothetical protein
MSKATRILTMTGVALLAGATIGAAPAVAAPASAQNTAATTQSADRVVDYYRTRLQCERAGRVGEFLNRWDGYDCRLVFFGIRRGWWALDVYWDGNGHGWPGHGHGWPGHGHGWPGHGGPGGGHGGPGGGHGGPGGCHFVPCGLHLSQRG